MPIATTWEQGSRTLFHAPEAVHGEASREGPLEGSLLFLQVEQVLP